MMRILYILILSLVSNLIYAQVNSNKCITTKLIKEELKNNPEYELMRKNLVDYHFQNNTVDYQSQPIITIPVVVHIVHRNTHVNIGTSTNISNAQIEDQLRILNEDYSKTNPEFPNPPRNTFINNSGNPQLKFCLATIDPNGNATTGVTRTPTTKSSWDADYEQNDMKEFSSGGIDNWDPLRYLNMWVCKLSNSGGGQTLGYAYLPGLQNSNNNSYKDGIVVDYQHFGSIGVASASSDGRTTTHEIGHYLGLSHTFCEINGCCDNDLDSPYIWGDVDDTPATEEIYFGAVNSNTNNNSCNDLNYNNIFTSNVLDMDENYMSYSSDSWMFSQGQVDVMLGTLNAPTNLSGRANLKNSTVTVNCSGIIGADSWDCDNQGNCNPGNGSGAYASYNACINSCECIGQSLPISEGFQNNSLPIGWSIVNIDNDKTWEVTSLAGYNSTSSIYINNSDYPANGEIDDLVLSTLNLSSTSPVDLQFDYAYTLWTDPNTNPNFSDTLQVLVSSDCGITWQKIWERSGIDLVTALPTFTGSAWVPSSNNDWDSESINLNNYLNQQDFVVKFRNITDYENNLFLDNINITGTSIPQSWNCDGEGNCIDPGTGNGLYSSLNLCNTECGTTSIEEFNFDVVIYPNPTDKYVNVNYDGLKNIYTILGKKLFETNENIINVSSLSKGVYVIKTGNMTMRFIKE